MKCQSCNGVIDRVKFKQLDGTVEIDKCKVCGKISLVKGGVDNGLRKEDETGS